MKYKYDAAAQALLERISLMREGDRLPNRNELASALGIARTTLEHAISDLAAQGVLESRQGSGTYVRRVTVPSKSTQGTRWNDIKIDGARRSDTWALICPNVMNDLMPSLLRGTEDVAHENGYQLIICNTDNDLGKLDDYLYGLTCTGVAGIVVMPNADNSANTEAWNAVARKSIPVVSCFRPLTGLSTPGIYCNAYSTGLLATRHLISLGCKRIAMISGRLYQMVYDRYQGYIYALGEAGLKVDPKLFSSEGDDEWEARGLAAAKRLFEDGARFDGVFAFNDRIANAVYALLRKHGLEPGRDIPVVGCDDTRACADMTPRLTSIRFPMYEVGRRAAETLLTLCNGKPIQNYFEYMDCELVIRESTGARGA